MLVFIGLVSFAPGLVIQTGACGVSLYAMSMSCTAISLFDACFPCRCAICSVLLSICINLSASPLALRCSRVIRWCIKPSCSANCANSSELKGGPLSESMHCGMPWSPNMRFNFAWVAVKDVQYVTLTSGYRVRLSMATRL